MEKCETYAIINKFECNGKIMVTVKVKNAVCVMPMQEYIWLYCESNCALRKQIA